LIFFEKKNLGFGQELVGCSVDFDIIVILNKKLVLFLSFFLKIIYDD
jgi:hypothetical protein